MSSRLPFLILSLFILFSACHGPKHVKHTDAPAYTPPPAQVKTTPAPDDMQVIITEDMMNKCFKALGPISGKEAYSVLFVNDTFTWTLINPQIHLHEGKADFTTDVNVVARPFAYTTSVTGDVSIWYDRPKNLINVKITKCIVEIYTKIFGAKYHLKDVDIASEFTDPFTFEGPTATSRSEERRVGKE